LIPNVSETQRLRNLYEINLGSECPASRGAHFGAYVHHHNIPYGIRIAVEYAMHENMISFVICTSTLAQGVNLPIRYLIIPSFYQGREYIKARDFHNLIGRSGRAECIQKGVFYLLILRYMIIKIHTRNKALGAAILILKTVINRRNGSGHHKAAAKQFAEGRG
jgi:superfamily II helicase